MDMPLKIVRNDITRMDTDAIVNTAGEVPVVGEGCDTAVHNAAGYEELLQYRIDHIGKKRKSTVFRASSDNAKNGTKRGRRTNLS